MLNRFQWSTTLALVLISLFNLNAQQVMYSYHLIDGTVDSITNLTYDTTVVRDQTDFNYGLLNDNADLLEVMYPFFDTFPGSQFTIKRPCANFHDINRFPTRTSVKLFTINDGERNGLCSGSMVSPRHVLTAAHCLTNFDTGELFTDSVIVSPVFDNGKDHPEFGNSLVLKAYIKKDWHRKGEDLALLELVAPLGNKTGWIGMGYDLVDTNLLQGMYYKYSYPNMPLHPTDTSTYNGDTLYYNYGKASWSQPHAFGVLNAFGHPGESGSSMIKVSNLFNYTSYGVLAYSNNLNHRKLTPWFFNSYRRLIQVSLSQPDPSLENPWAIYPNPSSGVVRLSNYKSTLPLNIRIYDLSGSIIFTQDNFNAENGIDLSDMPEAMYILHAFNAEQQQTFRIIKN